MVRKRENIVVYLIMCIRVNTLCTIYNLCCYVPIQSRGYYGIVAASGLGVGLALTTLMAEEQVLHPPQYPWTHGGVVSALDHER